MHGFPSYQKKLNHPIFIKDMTKFVSQAAWFSQSELNVLVKEAESDGFSREA